MAQSFRIAQSALVAEAVATRGIGFANPRTVPRYPAFFSFCCSTKSRLLFCTFIAPQNLRDTLLLHYLCQARLGIALLDLHPVVVRFGSTWASYLK
jgi:hypothetical protein